MMDTLGVSEIDTQADYDPRRHTVASVRGGEGSTLKIVEVVRRGWEGHGVEYSGRHLWLSRRRHRS